MASIKSRLIRILASGEDLLGAPDLPRSTPISARELPTTLDERLAWRASLRRAPRWVTLADSKLFSYEGAILAGRQLMLRQAVLTGEDLPKGFADAPPRYLATMVASLLGLGAFDETPIPSTDPLTRPAEAIIDLWETAGMGPNAYNAFLLSHVYLPGRREWFPLTPTMEAAAGPQR